MSLASINKGVRLSHQYRILNGDVVVWEYASLRDNLPEGIALVTNGAVMEEGAEVPTLPLTLCKYRELGLSLVPVEA